MFVVVIVASGAVAAVIFVYSLIFNISLTLKRSNAKKKKKRIIHRRCKYFWFRGLIVIRKFKRIHRQQPKKKQYLTFGWVNKSIQLRKQNLPKCRKKV